MLYFIIAFCFGLIDIIFGWMLTPNTMKLAKYKKPLKMVGLQISSAVFWPLSVLVLLVSAIIMMAASMADGRVVFEVFFNNFKKLINDSETEAMLELRRLQKI